MAWMYFKTTNGGLEFVEKLDQRRHPLVGEVCIREDVWNGEVVVIERSPATMFDRDKVSDIDAVKEMYADNAWGELYAMHNQERWSSTIYCCAGQLRSFKKFMNELLEVG